MKAIVPIKCNSDRVDNKNLRPFYENKSLFDIRMERLLEILQPTDIYVSSESPSVEANAARYGAHFLQRDEFFTKNDTPMSDVISHLVDRLPDDDDVIWSQVTEHLFSDFSDVIKVWERNRDAFDSLVVVKPLGSYLLDDRGYPVNFNFGRWHQHSQTLPVWHILPFTFHIVKRETVSRCNYYIGSEPYLHLYEGLLVDIDNESDFQQAQLIYKTIHDQTTVK